MSALINNIYMGTPYGWDGMWGADLENLNIYNYCIFFRSDLSPSTDLKPNYLKSGTALWGTHTDIVNKERQKQCVLKVIPPGARKINPSSHRKGEK